MKNEIENALAVREDAAPSTYIATTEDRGDLTWDPLARGYAWRVANELSNSALVPQHFRGKVADVLVALEMAKRMKMPPLQMLQSLYVVHGRPGLAAQFLIGLAKSRGEAIAWDVQRLEPAELEFERRWKEDGQWRTAKARMPNFRVVAYFKGHPEDRSPEVTTSLAIAEGWTANAKYLTMAELMLRYRAAAWLMRLYMPDLSLGIPTVEEVEDVSASADVIEAQPVAPPSPKATMVQHLSSTIAVPVEPAAAPAPAAPAPAREPEAVPVEPAAKPEEKQVDPVIVDLRAKVKAIYDLPPDDQRRVRLIAYGVAHQIRRWGALGIEGCREALAAAEQFPVAAAGPDRAALVARCVALSEKIRDLSGSGELPLTAKALETWSDTQLEDLRVELTETAARWETGSETQLEDLRVELTETAARWETA